jgi:hypothetical protein
MLKYNITLAGLILLTYSVDQNPICEFDNHSAVDDISTFYEHEISLQYSQ